MGGEAAVEADLEDRGEGGVWGEEGGALTDLGSSLKSVFGKVL
jgi:hypothetical protein